MEDHRHIRRADILLIVFFMLLALGIFVCFFAGRKEGAVLTLSCDGEEIGRWNLSETDFEKPAAEDAQTVHYCLILYSNYMQEGVSCEWYENEPSLSALSEGISYNLLSVSEAGVSMEAADCPDQICVHHIPISGDGESIICLPHKLAAEIKKASE